MEHRIVDTSNCCPYFLKQSNSSKLFEFLSNPLERLLCTPFNLPRDPQYRRITFVTSDKKNLDTEDALSTRARESVNLAFPWNFSTHPPRPLWLPPS